MDELPSVAGPGQVASAGVGVGLEGALNVSVGIGVGLGAGVNACDAQEFRRSANDPI